MKLMTRGRFACAVLSWIGAIALLVIAPVAMALPPVVDAGPDRTIYDTDNSDGEYVTVSTSAVDPEGDPMTYEWRIGGGSYGYTRELRIHLTSGTTVLTVFVRDNNGGVGQDNLAITIHPPGTNRPPTVFLGPDFTVNDTNGRAGENVALTSNASDPDGNPLTYEWYTEHPTEIPALVATTPNPTVSLPDGATSLFVIVRDPSGATSEDRIVVTVNPTRPPIANAGADRTVDDTDDAAGERVELNGSASSDPDGNIVRYAWYRGIGSGTVSLGTSTTPTLQAPLPDGPSTILLVVTDNVGNTATDTSVITVNAPTASNQLTANAGADRAVNDTDNATGENVLLDGSASTIPEGSTVTYTWLRLDGDSSDELGSGSSPTLPVRLPDGENVIRLVISDSSEQSSEDTVVITVTPPTSSGQPTANAGADRTVADTDGAAGENVALDGTASSDPDGSIVSYTWSRVNGESIENLGSGPTLQVPLPDGENVIRLVVTDNSGNSASSTVVITVTAPTSSAPTANAGADRTIADTDTQDGEDVVLDASYSVDPDGTIVDYAWSRVDGESTESLGNGVGPTLQTRLADGEHVIQLVVTDNEGNTASDTVIITVNKVVVTSLGNLPGLTPNQQRVGQALDRICGQLRDRSQGEGPQLSGDQQDLMNRCDGLQMGNTTANQVDALDELVADDFALARTQTLLFANTQYAGVMDRLLALRGGAKGLSLAGLNIIVDGEMVPLAQLQEMAKGLLGGGASADEPGGLLDDKWGLWARGNYSTGEKDRNTRSPGFDADQWAMVAGIDYRFNDQIVGGVSLAHGQSSIDIDDGEGGLETDSYAVSLYGSSYVAKKYYLDAIVNVANADYGADRNIAYVDGAGLVDTDARGETDGMTYSAGISGGRDFVYRGFTLSPTVGFFYIDATIDSFTEQGAGGLNLIYDEQSFQSFTGNFGVRATYAWNVSWGVLLPHVRIDYIREFKTDVDVFGVRFAADPNATSAPPILVETDNPDESYWRLATGLSAQFVHGISGYVEYQRLQSFQFISFQDVSMGLRFQKSF